MQVRRRMVLVVNLFVFLELLSCFVVAILDLVRDVEAIFHLFQTANSIWKFVMKYERCP